MLGLPPEDDPLIFTETSLPGAYIIDIARHEDERGFFARSFCEQEFAAHGLQTRWVQCNVSFNHRRGTLRGMHYQASPHEEEKLVRCTRGALHDVIIDLRPDSPAYRRHVGVDLTEDNRRMLYIPKGFAHGFITLADDTEAFYQMGQFYVPDAGRTLRWNDPAFGIAWPEPVTVIADRDRDAPDFGAGA